MSLQQPRQPRRKPTRASRLSRLIRQRVQQRLHPVFPLLGRLPVNPKVYPQHRSLLGAGRQPNCWQLDGHRLIFSQQQRRHALVDLINKGSHGLLSIGIENWPTIGVQD